MVVHPEKIDFRRFVYNDLIDYFIVCFEHQCNTKSSFILVLEIGVVLCGTFWHFLQHLEPQENRFDCTCGFINKSVVIKYHQLLSKV